MEPRETQPATQGTPQPSGPKFGTVFSTTLKVLLALVLISIGLAVIYGMFNSIDSSGSSSSKSDYTNNYANGRTYYNDKADNVSTKMPLSQWKQVIHDDIKGHCIREGMTAAEVERAVGKPTTAKVVSYDNGPSQAADKSDVWLYETRQELKKPCSKYDGEKCVDPVEYETKTATLYFSPKGNLTYPYLSGSLKLDLSDSGYSSCY
jgi:hypothetical protein